MKCEFVAGRLIDAYVYGEKHPYGVYTLPADIDALDTAAMKHPTASIIYGAMRHVYFGVFAIRVEERISSLFGGPGFSRPAGCDATVTRYPGHRADLQDTERP